MTEVRDNHESKSEVRYLPHLSTLTSLAVWLVGKYSTFTTQFHAYTGWKRKKFVIIAIELDWANNN